MGHDYALLIRAGATSSIRTPEGDVCRVTRPVDDSRLHLATRYVVYWGFFDSDSASDYLRLAGGTVPFIRRYSTSWP